MRADESGLTVFRRIPQDADDVGARHYATATLFGKVHPDKKTGPHSGNTEASRNSEQRTSTVARDVERDKVPRPRHRHVQ